MVILTVVIVRHPLKLKQLWHKMNKKKTSESTIMFTDMVGYSKLTGDNQTLALELLEEHDSICEPIIANYSGKIIKHIGDAIFAVFPSAVEGVNCAVEIQTELDKRNSLNTDDRRILIRIGLHYGETYHDGDELLGDGVNIASQVEPVAPFGGIAVTESVYNIVRGEKDIYSRTIGFIKFKNVDHPVRIHKVYLNLIDWIEETIEELRESMADRNIPLIKIKKQSIHKQNSGKDGKKYKDTFSDLMKEGISELNECNYKKAESTFNELFNLSREHNDGEGMGISLIRIGDVFHKEGDLSSALRNTISGIRTFAFEGFHDLEMQYRVMLADRYCEMGLVENSHREIKKIQKYFKNKVPLELNFQINAVLGKIFLNLGELEKSKTVFGKNITKNFENWELQLILKLCEVHLAMGELHDAENLLNQINLDSRKLTEKEQLLMDSFQILLSSRNNNTDSESMNILEKKCSEYSGIEPIYEVIWNLSQGHLWIGDLDSAEDCQQIAQDEINELINKISDTHIRELYRKNGHLHREIFSFLELPEGVESIEQSEEDDADWCFDCGKFTRDFFNYCPHCGVTLKESVLV